MPQSTPGIGEDVTHLMRGGSGVGDDVTSLMTGAQQSSEPEQPRPSLMSRAGSAAVEMLPTIGGTIGALSGNPVLAGIGGAAGAGYRALAQNAGELLPAARDVARNLISEPRATMQGFQQGAQEGAMDAAGQAALQGGASLVGGAIGRTLGRAAEPLMTKAVRSSSEATLEAFKYGRTPPVVKTMLDEGVNVTRGGIKKLDKIITEAIPASARQDAAVYARNELAARVMNIANQEPESILRFIMQAAQTPAIQSMLARGAYSSAAKVSGVTPEIIRWAMAGVASGMDEGEP